MAVNAGDAFLSVHPQVAGDFGRRLAAQVQAPVAQAGGQAAHHFGRSFGHGIAAVGKGIGVGIAAGLGLAVAVGVKAIPVLRQSVQGYRDHLKVVAQTTAAIRSTGGAANVTVGHVNRLTDALERKTTVDADVIQRGAAMLLTFTNVRNEVGKGNNVFDQATAVVTDMSVALGQDTKNSAIQLGKALNDPIRGITALQRVGVTFTDQQKKQIRTLVEHGHRLEAQKVILAELNKEFGGSAAAQATAAGRMAVAWHRLQDTLGSILLPVVDRFEGVLAAKVIPQLDALATRYGPAVQRVLLGIARQVGVAVDTFAVLGARAGLKALLPPGLAGGVDRLADGLRRLAAGAREAWPHVKQASAHLLTLLGGARQAGPALQRAGGGGKVLGDALAVTAPILDVLARNVHHLVPLLPVLLAGFLGLRAVKAVLGPVRDLSQTIANFTSPLTAVAMLRQASAMRVLAAAKRGEQAASTGAAAAQAAENVATSRGLLLAVRARVATLAQAAAQKVAAVATVAWSVALKALRLAWVAMGGPIGLAIAGIVVGLVLLYKHSEAFRKVVDKAFRVALAVARATWDWVKGHWPLLLGILTGPVGAAVVLIVRNWDTVKKAVGGVLDFIVRGVRSWFNATTTVALGILRVMGRLPGPMGAPFRAAEKAVTKARDTVNRQLDAVQARVDRLRGKDLPVNAQAKVTIAKSTVAWLRATHQKIPEIAAGGPAPAGGRGPTADDRLALLSTGEHVWTAAETAAVGGHSAMERLRGAARAGLLRLATGGGVGGGLERILAADAGGQRKVGQHLVDALGRMVERALAAYARQLDRLEKASRSFLPAPVGGALPAWLDSVRGTNQQIVRRIFSSMFGWFSAQQWRATNLLVSHESGWNNLAQNPTSTAFGLFQFLNSTWNSVGIAKTRDPRLQAIGGGRYIRGRYHDPVGAWNFWAGHHWYDLGGWLPPGLSLAVNGTGRPERVVPPGGGGGELHLHFHGPVYGGRAGADQLAADVVEALRRRKRGNGQMLLGIA